MRIVWVLVLGLLSQSLVAGSFDNYEWRLAFQLGSDAYQPILRINYTYKTDGPYDPVVALPRDGNLDLFSLKFKVDGEKAEPVLSTMRTYWSHGDETRVYLPPEGGKKVSAEVIYILKNIFLIPPAPTAFSVPCKKLEVGFSPINGFQFGGLFAGRAHEFERNRIAARPGESNVVMGFKLRKVKATTLPALLFLKPKLFQFSFESLVGVDTGLGGSYDADTRAGSSGIGITENIKPYNMVFYREDPVRDWAYVPTWVQQETIYLPFGVELGGHTKTKALFAGASDNREDLLPWRLEVEDKHFFDSFPSDMDMEFDGVFKTVESFRQMFTEAIEVDPAMSRLIVAREKDKWSPARANIVLATELGRQLKIQAVPAFVTNLNSQLLGGLPVGGFSAVLTAFKVKNDWYFLDGSDPDWTLKNSFEKVKGKNLIILDGGQLRFASF